MTRPNVLFVVWDACRLDTAREHAPTLESLAEDNLWFENAITPAGYSLPAHASIFTGEYAHEHGTFSRTHEFESLPLLDELGAMGYDRLGVSANGFASPRYRFDEGFDTFYNTQGRMVYPDGLDIHRYARQAGPDEGEFSAGDVDYGALLSAVLHHPNPTKSLANVVAAGISELANRQDVLQKVPHPRFGKYQEFSYSPSKNTTLIRSYLDDAPDMEEPFFIFTNYMDAHHPYAPPDRLQKEYCGRTFSYRELAHLAERTLPWNHMQLVESEEGFDQEELETVRRLYAGEVRHADEHLDALLDALKENDLYEDTVVVVTADHGENLGETDQMSEARMGHECSASEQLLRVPLVIAHPELEPATVDEYVSLKDLYSLFTEGLDRLLQSGGSALAPLVPEEGMVASQVPPPANPALRDRYPTLADVLERTLSVGYSEGWKVVATSTDERYCWHEGDERPVAEAPDDLVTTTEADLLSLVERTDTDQELSDAEVSQLEALGYL